MANMLDFLLTIVARAAMTFTLASMHLAVQLLVALHVALQIVLLTALHHLLAASATTCASDRRLARWTRARMTQLRARMHAAIGFAATIATTVRHIASIVLRILEFATETEVLVRHLLRNVLTRTAAPAFVRLGTGRPLDDALQVNDVIAIGARPNRLERLYHFAAHQTLQAARIDFTNQFLALRTIRCVHFECFRWTFGAATIRFEFVDFLRRRLAVFFVFVLVR